MTFDQDQDMIGQMMAMDQEMVNEETSLGEVHNLVVNMIVMETDTSQMNVSQDLLMIELAQAIEIVTRTDTDQDLMIEEVNKLINLKFIFYDETKFA